MNDTKLRQQIHQAVDAYGAGLRENPFLAQRVLSLTHGKESPIMKRKLSAGTILLIILLLASMTALAVGITLSVEDMWQQSFDKMNTTGEIRNLSDETTAEITMEEAIAIARSAIIAKFGTPEAELDAMGVYPTYAARGWDGKTDDYPSEWEIYFSSRTDVHLDSDFTEYGPTGEYRVYINAETKEVTFCHWYTGDFWSRAQAVWNCGSYDEVYQRYTQNSFYTQSVEQQQYWERCLAEKGYAVYSEDEKDKELLRSNYLDMLYYDNTRFLDATDPQAAKAWSVIEQKYGYDTVLLQQHGFVAVCSDLESATDDIFISFNYYTSRRISCFWTDQMASDVTRVGTFLVRFSPGTQQVVSTAHMPYSYWSPFAEPVTTGQLYEQTDWDNDDLIAFSKAFALMDRAMQRMQVAGYYDDEMEPIARDFIRSLGGNPERYPEAPAELNAQQWFAEESPWDAELAKPRPTYQELSALYGDDSRFWPLEVRAALEPRHYRMPKEGETTVEQAIQIAIDHVIEVEGQDALDALGDYTVGCLRYSPSGDPDAADCRWIVFITDDPTIVHNGWQVTWCDWGNHSDTPDIQPIFNGSNG